MIAALIVLVLAQGSEHDHIPRRDQARGAFHATAQGTYEHHCSHCHGDDGKGNGRLWPMDLSPRPPDLTATTLDEMALARFITGGSAASGKSSLCPPWERTIPQAERERLVRYLASLARRPTQSTRQGVAPAGQPPADFPWIWVCALVVEALVLARVLAGRRGGCAPRAHVREGRPRSVPRRGGGAALLHLACGPHLPVRQAARRVRGAFARTWA